MQNMKFFKTKTCFWVIVTICLLNACANDDEPGDDGDGNEYMTAIINDVPYTGMNISASITINSTGTFSLADEILVVGSANGLNGLSVSFYGPFDFSIAKQTYENGILGPTAACDTENEVCVVVQTISPIASTNTTELSLATINVSDVDYKAGGFIEGTFNGDIYTEDSVLVVSVKDGEFRALIDE